VKKVPTVNVANPFDCGVKFVLQIIPVPCAKSQFPK